MMNAVRKYWWKALSIVLLLYVLLGGLLSPLSPGIKEVSQEQLTASVATSIEITGFNTRFTSAETSMKVWMWKGGEKICAKDIKITSENKVQVVFSPAQTWSNNLVNLTVNNDLDGTMLLPDAFWIKEPPNAASIEQIEFCKPSIVSEKENYFGLPNRPILYETIRNLLFHVPMWFSMIFILLISLIKSLRVLRHGRPLDDIYAAEAAKVGLFFGVLGAATGAIWARFTWGDWWPNDVRLNGAAVAILIYCAYLVLRSATSNQEKRARVAAVYNIFAFFMMLLFIFIIPRMNDSLHPGVGGNPAFSSYDLDDHLRLLFYPAVIGFSLLGLWMVTLRVRMSKLLQTQSSR